MFLSRHNAMFDLTIYIETCEWAYAMIHTTQNYKKILNLTNICSAMVLIYDSTKWRDVRPLPEVTAAVTPSQSHEQNSGIWQFIHPYDCRLSIFLHPILGLFGHFFSLYNSFRQELCSLPAWRLFDTIAEVGAILENSGDWLWNGELATPSLGLPMYRGHGAQSWNGHRLGVVIIHCS